MPDLAASSAGWASDVLKILETEKVTQRALADEMAVTAPMVHQYLHGTRSPSRDMALRINAAVGRLTGSRSTKGYLDCVVELIFGPPEGESGEKVVDRYVWQYAALFDGIDDFLKPGYWHYIDGELRRRSVKDARRVVYDLLRNFFKRMMRELGGIETRSLEVDDVVKILQKHDIYLATWLKPEEDQRIPRLKAEFHRSLLKALSSVAREPDSAKVRHEQEFEVMKAFGEAQLAIYHHSTTRGDDRR